MVHTYYSLAILKRRWSTSLWVLRPGLIVIALLVLSYHSYTQGFNLPVLLEMGKKKYPFLKAKQAEVKSSQQKVHSAQTEYLPNLTLGHQYTYATSNNVEGAFFPNEGTALSPSGGIRPDNIYQGAYGSLTSALMDWKIVNFGKVAANVHAVKAENERTTADYENELFQYQIGLCDAYLLVLASHHLTQVQRFNLQRAEDYRNAINAQVVAGLRPGVDSSLAHAEYIKAQMLLLESDKNERGYLMRLQELLGGTKDSIALDTMNFFNRLPDALVSKVSNIAQAPALRVYQANVELSKWKSITIRRSFYPSISLIGAAWARGSGISNKDQSYRTDFARGTSYQVYNYLVGVAFRWNLISYVRIHNDFRSEQLQMDRHKFLYENQYLRQNRQLSEAEMQLSVSLQQAQLAPVQKEAAKLAFAQAKTRYESGLTDLPTFTQSLVTLSRAEADTYIAYSNTWRSLLMKAAAAGDLSVFLNQIQ